MKRYGVRYWKRHYSWVIDGQRHDGYHDLWERGTIDGFRTEEEAELVAEQIATRVSLAEGGAVPYEYEKEEERT